MKQIDIQLKLRTIYKFILIVTAFLVILVTLFLNTYQYKNEWVDRFNPFMRMKIGYATLPKEVTYNEGQKYNSKEKGPKFPDPYKDVLVVDDPFGRSSFLSFSGGQSPKGRNYAMVQHKGLYVRQISFISWDSIPEDIRDKLNKEYIDISTVN